MFKPFEETAIRGMRLKNRFVRSATWVGRAAEDGSVTDGLIDFYSDLARGGVGLIITGNAFVHLSGRLVSRQIGIDRDDWIPGLMRLTDAVHKYESKIVIQINYAGGRVKDTVCSGIPLVPTLIQEPFYGRQVKEITRDDISEIINSFGNAALRAKGAGFDGVQLHGAHGYLISEFLSPYTNRRPDKYGGNIESRCRFVEEIYKSIREKVGDDYPILIKMNCNDFMPGGLDTEEGARIAKKLSDLGMGAIEISGSLLGLGGVSIRIGQKVRRPSR